jgi:hypothetical protein
VTQRTSSGHCAGQLLHADDDHAPLGRPITLLGVVSPAFVRPLRVGQGQFELGTITAPPFFFAASNLIDDPGLQHRNLSAYAYGLQHRGPTVKLLPRIACPQCCYRRLSALLEAIVHRFSAGRAARALTSLSRSQPVAPQSFPTSGVCTEPSVLLGRHDHLILGCPAHARVARQRDAADVLALTTAPGEPGPPSGLAMECW